MRCCSRGFVLAESPLDEVAPKSGEVVQRFLNHIDGQSHLSHEQKLELLRKKVKYVFVLFQENRSFDHYFGTYPGARGLFTQTAGNTSGFVQPIVNIDGSESISPFLIPQTVKDVNGKTVQIYPADTDSIDHSHTGVDNSLDVDANKVAHNDRYALDEEGLTTLNGKIVLRSTGLPPTSPPSLAQKQKGELAVAHIDCDTIPFCGSMPTASRCSTTSIRRSTRPLDAERDCDDCRAVRRDAMGAASGRGQQQHREPNRCVERRRARGRRPGRSRVPISTNPH